ncbi:MAG: Hpt domain-containing protein [Flavobacteriaceae bacterium CG_4_8_14_3_um_filter_34_10]|nr:Hpt domain-containing protein [Flavobacteriia bacterium]OIP50264.1 MAG: Hpt domain-containing protein [Flavobacteriaceae bacterium CG2_30_34_30]PIQ19612.1 MAG: Hpt domain-containing protein [Flavobacteriaceae bacterium CG18_big_fil_WC_8_21_14_2_50_34_36]PIV49059.1 MAG: Hpt domain-containing protein [Flavobacteriaceae bacterium CG02_land_8_20_14_3_00_34_13]PIX10536.1 MAG: Hpt domain-containing protein [Flavobacteriaceae bacterium CG_4_8_14_3_um_filter_34_10]PIZ08527.1 MAG: Hpt domain-contain
MEKAYSFESLNEIAGGDEEFIAVIAKTFLDEIPPDLKALAQAIENNNKPLAYQFAHKMKPNLEMLGLNLTKDVTAIESWTNTTKNKSAAEPHIQKIESILNQVFTELKTDFHL